MTHELQKTFNAPVSRLSRDWGPFADKLAAALEKLEEDQYLVIAVKRTNYFVQFAAQGSFGLRAETTGNAYLEPAEQLNEKTIVALAQAGWNPPSNPPEGSTPELDPDGSPNFFIDYPNPVPFSEVARLAIKTFAEILHVPHPGFLTYERFDAEGNELLLPELGLKAAEPRSDHELGSTLLQLLKESTGVEDLEYDSSGLIQLRCGAIGVAIALGENPARVRIASILMSGVDASPELLDRLNEFNGGLGTQHLYLRDGNVVAITEVPASPFVSAHVVHALDDFCETMNGIGALLQGEFGGETTFSTEMPSVLRH
jgi:hypothetical protein